MITLGLATTAIMTLGLGMEEVLAQPTAYDFTNTDLRCVNPAKEVHCLNVPKKMKCVNPKKQMRVIH